MKHPIAWIATTLCLFGYGLLPSAHAEGLECSRPADSLPHADVKPGTADPNIPIEHIIVIMQENHSFDAYFGRLNESGYYEGQVDGLRPEMWNPDKQGKPVHPFHNKVLCVNDTAHTWNASHLTWNGGLMNQFVVQNGHRSMGSYNDKDLPYYYALAKEFAIGDRYFASLLSMTDVNRYFLYAGTAFGQTINESPPNGHQWDQKTIFDVLNQYGISWKYYRSDSGYIKDFASIREHNQKKMVSVGQFKRDLKKGHLPRISFIESLDNIEDEHPSIDVQFGQNWVANRIKELMHSQYWQKSALFFTYDEAGGQFDETKFNLPALTRRDANANAPFDLFDFANPPHVQPPNLPSGHFSWGRILQCIFRDRFSD
ncbi:MAG: hypothetical protein HY074_07090 [Deltaproteobacteria bacterium]|nr:hypothetical protein [Deltaproteobacteria bacterium]